MTWPATLLYLASGFGCAEAAVFYLWVRESHQAEDATAADVAAVIDV